MLLSLFAYGILFAQNKDTPVRIFNKEWIKNKLREASQDKDTTVTSFDKKTSIKKEVRLQTSGTGGGFSGSAPALTIRTITKYSASGKIIYKSHHIRKFEGCILSIPEWNVTAFDTSGASKTLTLSNNKDILIVCEFDKSGSRIAENKIPIIEFERNRIPKWLDIEDDY